MNFISSNAVPKAMTLTEIQHATTQDKTLQCVIHLARNNGWHNLNNLPQEYRETNQAELHLFKHIKDNLTVNNGATVLLKGSQIVVPMQLREKAISLAHEGHQGIVKTKQLLRE